jgi:DDE superfamily endonuclease
MDLEAIEDTASRFAAYVEELTEVIGHADRAAPLRDYCTGLLVSEGRKSVEPMAAVTSPGEVPVQHQKLLHFVATAPWSGSWCGAAFPLIPGDCPAQFFFLTWANMASRGVPNPVDHLQTATPPPTGPTP